MNLKTVEIKAFAKTLRFLVRHEGDEAVLNEVFRRREYAPCEAVIQSAKNGILDVGAHAGFFAVYTAALNPTAPILAFEPSETNFAALKENLKLNHIKNVTAKRLAVAEKAGPVTLKLSADDMNHSLIAALEPTGAEEKVEATTLERILEKNRLERIDLLKMDCEGAEVEIVETAPREVLEKIGAVFLEYHDWDGAGRWRDMKRKLESAGFKVQHLPNARMKALGYLWSHRS